MFRKDCLLKIEKCQKDIDELETSMVGMNLYDQYVARGVLFWLKFRKSALESELKLLTEMFGDGGDVSQ